MDQESINLVLNKHNLNDPIVRFHLMEIGLDADKLDNKSDDYIEEFTKMSSLHTTYPSLFNEILNYITARENNFSDLLHLKFVRFKEHESYRNLVSSNISFGVLYKDILPHIISYLDVASFLAMASVCKKMFCFMMSNDILENIKEEYLKRTMQYQFYDEYGIIYDCISTAKKNLMLKELKLEELKDVENILINDTNEKTNIEYIFDLAIKKGNLELLQEIVKQKNLIHFDYKFAIKYSAYARNKSVLIYLLDRTPPHQNIRDALIYACYLGYDDICKILLDYKKKYSNFEFNNVIEIVEKRGYYNIFKLFISKGGVYFSLMSSDDKQRHLNDSIKGGNIDIVKYWINQKIDINYDCNYYSSLQTAVKYSRYEITKYLIENGARPDQYCSYKKQKNFNSMSFYLAQNLLSLCCDPENRYNPNITKIVKLLLELGVTVQTICLYECFDNNLFDAFKLIIQHNSFVLTEIIIDELVRNLDLVVKHGYLDFFIYLTKMLKPYIWFDILQTLIDTGIEYRHIDIVEYILGIEDLTKEEKKLLIADAIITAARYGYFNIVKYLHNIGGDIHHRNDMAFLKAVSSGNLELIRYLYNNGANINSLHKFPSYSDCALYSARHNPDILKFLIDKGIDIHQENDQALFFAITEHIDDVPEMLLENGADVSTLYKYELTELFTAYEDENEDMIHLLEKYGYSFQKHKNGT